MEEMTQVLSRGGELADPRTSAADRRLNCSSIIADTTPAVGAVIEALGALIADLPGGIRRPRQLQLALGIDYKVCWNVFNLITADDPLSVVKYTPSSSAIKRLLTSAKKRGVKTGRITAVQSAIEEFTRVVNAHADDRNTFDSMVSAVAAEDGDSASELQSRRSAYRSMSQIWGAQTELHLSTVLVRRAESGDGVDECLLTVKHGFRLLLPTASPIVYGSRASGDAAKNDPQSQIPLDPQVASQQHAPLLPKFCSTPLPNLRTDEGGAGWLYTKLATEGIGRQSTVDLAFGMVARNVIPPMDEVGGRRLVRSGVTFRTPTAELLQNFLIHRSLCEHLNLQTIAFMSMPGDESPGVARIAPQLTVSEKIQRLGAANRPMMTPEWPRYSELLKYAANKLKWDLSEFEVYRLRVQYPVFGSVVRMEFAY